MQQPQYNKALAVRPLGPEDLFAGGLTAAQVRAMGHLTGGNPAMGAACDALLHGRVPYRSDVEAG